MGASCLLLAPAVAAARRRVRPFGGRSRLHRWTQERHSSLDTTASVVPGGGSGEHPGGARELRPPYLNGEHDPRPLPLRAGKSSVTPITIKDNAAAARLPGTARLAARRSAVAARPEEGVALSPEWRRLFHRCSLAAGWIGLCLLALWQGCNTRSQERAVERVLSSTQDSVDEALLRVRDLNSTYHSRCEPLERDLVRLQRTNSEQAKRVGLLTQALRGTLVADSGWKMEH
eukprot:TRINITY_DN29893_c0_g1_i1.p2 TRINITY_DN29893_c0_g1~~TRINITY_DN29893_c0_g1_i1.p2  ORF type:complete len:231 (+),score=36.79 TRINITY_DN29893_c0_g1_i1:89-781(+)